VTVRLSPVTQPPYLVSQQGSISAPESDRLEEAVLWDYTFTFGPEGDVSFDVTYNEDRTVVYTIAGEQVTVAEGAVPRVSVADGLQTVVFERLDVIDVQSVRASVQGVSFNESTLPFVQNAQQIEIGGGPARISVHLTAVLQTLLGNSPFASQPTSVECRYAYAIGGVSIEAPVVLLARQDVAIGFDEELMEQVEAAIRQWLDAVKPPATDARLVFALTFWSAIAQTDAPLLRLTNLSLPMSDVVL
jgi:hypothetical protein